MFCFVVIILQCEGRSMKGDKSRQGQGRIPLEALGRDLSSAFRPSPALEATHSGMNKESVARFLHP